MDGMAVGWTNCQSDRWTDSRIDRTDGQLGRADIVLMDGQLDG